MGPRPKALARSPGTGPEPWGRVVARCVGPVCGEMSVDTACGGEMCRFLFDLIWFALKYFRRHGKLNANGFVLGLWGYG